jgi:hypothetical protein
MVKVPPPGSSVAVSKLKVVVLSMNLTSHTSSLSPSGSVSFVRMQSDTSSPSGTVSLSSSGIGGSFLPGMMKVMVAVSVPPLPSLMEYGTVSTNRSSSPRPPT